MDVILYLYPLMMEQMKIDHESFYIYDESESSEESWTNVNGC